MIKPDTIKKSREEPLLPLYSDAIHVDTASLPEGSTPLHSDDAHTEKTSAPEEPPLPLCSDDPDIEKALPPDETTPNVPKNKTATRAHVAIRYMLFLTFFHTHHVEISMVQTERCHFQQPLEPHRLQPLHDPRHFMRQTGSQAQFCGRSYVLRSISKSM